MDVALKRMTNFKITDNIVNLACMLKSSELIVYKASAGSGKTYALAREFLKIVLANPYDYKRILAVTFTRKATEEMKSRIIENLAQLKNKDPKSQHLRKEIIHSLQPIFPDISMHLDNNAALALELILHDYSNFNISTIDSFFQAIIRSFAKELDLPIGMEIELDTQSALAAAVEQVLKAYESGKDEISQWIEDFVSDRIDEDKNWKIEDSLLQFSRELFNEDFRNIANEFALSDEKPDYKKVVSRLKEIIRNYTAFFNYHLDEINEYIDQNQLDINGYKGRSTIRSFLNKLTDCNLEITKTLQDFLDTDIIFPAKTNLTASEKIKLEQAWHSIFKPFILESIAYVTQHERQYISAKAVLKNMYAFVLLDAINDELKKYKAEENLVLISDTNNIISLLSEKDAVPFIFEKSGSFIKYILLDEFQDTSLLQWKGLSKLVLEILDNANGIVLIVGDPKQSIYRWRGGKMNLIIDGIQQDLQHHWKQRKETPLNDNWRSAKEIVTFNNAFFKQLKAAKLLDNDLYEAAYLDVEQNNKKQDIQGLVRFHFFDADNKKKLAEGETPVKTKILEDLAKTITSFKQKKLNDIAILTRTNTEGILVAQYLSEQHIPVVSAESLLLYSHRHIRLMIAALYYINFPDEQLYAVQLNYLLAQHEGAEDIQNELKREPDFNYSFILHYPVFERTIIHEQAQKDVWEIVQMLVSAFNLLRNENEYVLRFQDIVLQHCSRYSNKLNEFLEFWETQKKRFAIMPPDGVNAVKIMTIHKSKGLQFPVVILPFADWDIKPKPDQKIWIKSEVEPFNQLQAFSIETKKENLKSVFAAEIQKETDTAFIDNINLLYVALTRAESELHVISVKPAGDPHELNKLNKIIYPVIEKLNLDGSHADADEFYFGKGDGIFPHDKKTWETEQLHVPSWSDYKKTLQLKQHDVFNKEQETGTQIHELLAENMHGNISDRLANYATDERLSFEQLFTDIQFIFEQKGWNADKWQQLNERPIFFKEQLLIPDKLLISEDEIIVLDYKTGVKNKKHHQQILTYKAVLGSMFKQPIKGYLLYLKTMELETVSK